MMLSCSCAIAPRMAPPRSLLAGPAHTWLDLPASADLSVQAFPLGDLPGGDHALRLTSLGVGPVELDGFAIVESTQADAVRFVPVVWQSVPEIETGPQPNTLILKYADVPTYYGLAWTGENSEVRQILSEELDRTLRYFVHEHVQKVLRGQGSGHFTNAFVRPIPVPPHASRVLIRYGVHGDAGGGRRAVGCVCRHARWPSTKQWSPLQDARRRLSPPPQPANPISSARSGWPPHC